MDFHKSLPTPKVSSQDWYYSKKLRTSLMGIYCANQEVIHCFMYDESIAGVGLNEVISILDYFLKKLQVVIEMGSVAHFSTPYQTESNGKMIENKNNKIPQYAKDYRNEYLFVIGINKTCGEFLRVLNEEEKVAEGFDTPQDKKLMFLFRKFLKAQELGYLKDTTEFYFEESDAGYIDKLETTVSDYFDLYYDVGSWQFDQEKYDNDYPSLREFHECFERFKKKINIREETPEEFISRIRNMDFGIDSDSDSDSVSDCDSDCDRAQRERELASDRDTGIADDFMQLVSVLNGDSGDYRIIIPDSDSESESDSDSGDYRYIIHGSDSDSDSDSD